jgi:hypothetical protein
MHSSYSIATVDCSMSFQKVCLQSAFDTRSHSNCPCTHCVHACTTHLTLLSLQDYVVDRRLTDGVSARLKRHFRYYYFRTSVFKESAILSDLPQGLCARVRMENYGPLLQVRTTNLCQRLLCNSWLLFANQLCGVRLACTLLLLQLCCSCAATSSALCLLFQPCFKQTQLVCWCRVCTVLQHRFKDTAVDVLLLAMPTARSHCVYVGHELARRTSVQARHAAGHC